MAETSGPRLPKPKIEIGERPVLCLRFIFAFLHEKEKYPTHQEIADYMKVSRMTAQRYLDILKKKKLIKPKHERARNIEITPEGLDFLEDEHPVPVSQRKLFENLQ